MSTKLPPDAFAHYLALGAERSHQAVADHYGVSKKTVTRRAAAEDWRGRLERIEADARARTDEKATESLEAMADRHLKTVRFIQKKAIETLRSLPLGTGMDAIRALDLAIKQERLIRGEPSDRTAVAVEDVIKREYARWMTVDEEEADAGHAATETTGAEDQGDDA